MPALRESGFLDSVIRFAPFYSLMCIILFGLFGLYNSLWASVRTFKAVSLDTLNLMKSVF